MTAGILTVLAIAVGFPLLAFWLGGRRFWGRLRGPVEGQVYREMVLRHRLRPGEITQVEGAVTWGRELGDPRLRAAVVDWAQQLQNDSERRRTAHPRRRRVLGTLLLLWATGVLIVGAVRVAHGDLGPLLNMALYLLVFGVSGYLAARGPRRAIERNSGPPPTTGGASADVLHE